jgi:hypothetical protein
VRQRLRWGARNGARFLSLAAGRAARTVLRVVHADPCASRYCAAASCPPWQALQNGLKAPRVAAAGRLPGSQVRIGLAAGGSSQERTRPLWGGIPC